MPPKFTKVATNATGQVLWFNKQDGFGKLTFKQYGEVFVHHSQIVSPINKNGKNFLESSQTVKCDIVCGPKGNQAEKVTAVSTWSRRSAAISSGDRQQRAPSESSSTGKPESCATEYAPNMSEITLIEKDLRGEVSHFDRNRRHGFILIRQYGSIVCHADNIVFQGLSTQELRLQPTQIVKCDVGRNKKGVLFAVNIHVICEATSENVVASDSDKKPEAVEQHTVRHKELHKAEIDERDDSEPSGIIAKDVLGEVTMYNPIKKFGFINVQGYDAAYVPAYALMKIDSLKSKQIVKCDITKGPKSSIALNVRLIADPNPNETTPKNASTPSKNVRPVEDVKTPKIISEVRPSKSSVGVKPLMASAPPVPPPLNPMYPAHQVPCMNPYYVPPQPGPFPYPPQTSYPVYPYPQESPPPYNAKPLDLEQLRLSHQEPLISKSNSKDEGKKNTSRKKKTEAVTSSGKSVTKTSKSKKLCEICEDRLEDPVTVPCGHLFCRECIDEWLAVNPSCPVDGKAISKKSVKQAVLVTVD